MGWRFINPIMKARYGVDTMPETADNVARDFSITREAQDAFAYRSQQRAVKAAAEGFFAEEIVAVEVSTKKSATSVSQDEHPRAETTLEGLAKLKPLYPSGTVTSRQCLGDQ